MIYNVPMLRNVKQNDCNVLVYIRIFVARDRGGCGGAEGAGAQ